MKHWWVVLYPRKRYDDILDTIKREDFDIRTYCPMVDVVETKKGIIKVVKKPLMFNYMFWLFDMEVHPYSELKRYLPFRLLRFNGDPCCLTPAEIRAIKNKVKSLNGNFEKMRRDAKYLRNFIGKKVSIRDGAFSGMVGIIDDSLRAGMVVVELLVFNRPVKCELSIDYLEFING